MRTPGPTGYLTGPSPDGDTAAPLTTRPSQQPETGHPA